MLLQVHSFTSNALYIKLHKSSCFPIHNNITMGKSSSTHSGSSSKARSLAGDDHRRSRTRHRTNSNAINVASSTLNVPGSSSHRRSRSANAMVGNASLEPPPPYSVATDAPPHALPINTSASTVSRVRSQASSHRANSSSSANLGRAAGGKIPSIGSQYTHSYTMPAGARSSWTAEYLRAPMRRGSVDNALETLRKYDTVIIVDDSHSMKGRRWRQVRTFPAIKHIEFTQNFSAT